MHLSIERVNVALHGVSAQLAQAAVTGLEAEVRRRLRVWPDTDLPAPRPGGPAAFAARAVTDAAALRGLIAERVVLALRAELERTPRAAGGG
jgi:hypothetical protein